ncbi:MAG: methyl-accepting chemotaxis protein [Magnetovibrio sp.]|nr:methyl-accepting chemotaxis protein [Magnetovibrio sp.]
MFTIKQKILGIGVISVLSLVILSGISFYSGSKVSSASALNETRQEQIRNVNEMRRATLEIMLAAMDTLVDKAEGTIMPERKQLMQTNIKFLRERVQQLIADSDTAEERKIAEGLGNMINGLEKGVLVDMQALLESNASDEEFGALDDVLDANGIGLDEELGLFAASVAEEVAEATEDMHGALSLSKTLTTVAAVASIGLLGFMLFTIGRSITSSLSNMTGAMLTLAEGDKTVTIPATGQTDEIGQMADAVQVFKDNMIKAEQLAEEQAQEQRMREERAHRIENMTHEFDSSVGGMLGLVSSASTELQSTAQTMSSTADQTSQQASNVAAAAEQASANVQTVASAAEELSSSISEISRQVAQSTQVAGTAVSEVDGANDKVQGLASAANKIGEVVALITDIADQTNLLALNATIEAARAGEAGKGFAVVASEVKNLANQTAKATEEISSQIGGIQGATQDAVSAIGSIGGIINQINEISSTIAAAVEEQGAATQEIARNVEQASSGTAEVSSNITLVTQAASETGASSNEVLGASSELSQQAETLRTKVDKFISDIKQA